MHRSAVWLLAIFFVPFLVPQIAGADEVVQLIDKTRIVGKIVHYYDGVLTVQLPSGARMKLPKEKIRELKFKLPKPRAELSTPRKTFERLRKAALRGDLETYFDAHSTYYQMFLNHQATQAGPKKFRSQLKKEWGNIRLEVVGTQIKGDTAVLKVRRRQADQAEEGEFRFVKENGEWKMILPL